MSGRDADVRTPQGRRRPWLETLRERVRRSCRSLVVRCGAGIAIYAVLIVLLIFGISRLGDALYNSAFPSIESVLEHREPLGRDQFDVLGDPALGNAEITVFDGEGTRLYSSSETIARNVRASDLAYINDYADGRFYEVLDNDDPASSVIMLVSYDDAEGTRGLVGWCALDDELDVVAGDLFADKGRLTQHQFDFIKGAYDARMSVESFSYHTNRGEERHLVFVAPLVTAKTLEGVFDSIDGLWLFAVPTGLALTAAVAWYVVGQIRHAVVPLNHAIDAYRSSCGMHDDAAARTTGTAIPVEFEPTYQNFIDLMDQLRAARDSQNRIVADLSHDLKTPLTVLYGYARAFCDGRVPPESKRHYHELMAKKSLAACDLIETLSAYSKLAHPDFTPHLVPRDPIGLLEQEAEEARGVVEQAGCKFDLELPQQSTLPTVLVDPQLVHRVLLNLVGNACQHNPAGTAVVISCRLVRGEKNAGTPTIVRISVGDTGDGIAPEVANDLFEPFVTSGADRSSCTGTGLGLTIARTCAELMGGQLRLNPRPSRGLTTEFLLELPAASDHPANEKT